MRSPQSVCALTELGRIRLSPNFFMREFLYSEVANFHAIPNIPEDPDLAVKAGSRLCEELLEPLQASFGRIAIRSGYRSPTVNGFCSARQLEHKKCYTCGSNETNRAAHIWDRRDAAGRMGATVTIVVPWFDARYPKEAWRSLAWWIHDHLPYSAMSFFPVMTAFNLTWREEPERSIRSYIPPLGCLTRPGMDNHGGDHSAEYEGFPTLVRG
jgi:hypothetical protein